MVQNTDCLFFNSIFIMDNILCLASLTVVVLPKARGPATLGALDFILYQL